MREKRRIRFRNMLLFIFDYFTKISEINLVILLETSGLKILNLFRKFAKFLFLAQKNVE